MTIEKSGRRVEVHQLQFSYQVVDVQLSRNDELRGFHPDPVHRQNVVVPESVVQEDCVVPNGTEDSRFWFSDTRDSGVETPSTKHQTAQKSLKVLTEFKLVLRERSMGILRIGMQRPRSKQHYARALLQKRSRNVEEKAAEFKNKVQTVKKSH